MMGENLGDIPLVTPETSAEVPRPPTLSPDDVVIAVMGVTGAGKSTFISLFAEDAQIGHGLQSCTSNVSIHAATINGQKCRLVDTPGFDDTNRPDAEILREVANWLNISHENRIQLAGIIYLHRISDNRLGGAAMKNLRMFKRLCGKDSLPCVVLATTMWNKANLLKDEQREKELLSRPDFWADMVNQGSQVFRHDNGVESAAAIMEYIIGKQHRVTLDIQKEMASGKTLDETGAGLEVQTDMTALTKKHEQEMNTLRQELQEAKDMHDSVAVEEIHQLRAELADKIRSDEEARRSMQVDMETLRAEREAELQRQRDEAHRRELDHQKEMADAQMKLMAIKHENEAEAQRLQLQVHMAQMEAEAAKRDRERAEQERYSQGGCVVM
ncbi:P-loop containing nucleoside triphosphate hydrolase protein [Trichoderma sp. TUCIM 5745]